MRGSSTPNASSRVAAESAGVGSMVNRTPSVDRATRRWEIDVSHVRPWTVIKRGSLASTPGAPRRHRLMSRRAEAGSNIGAASSPGARPRTPSATRRSRMTSPRCRIAAGLNTPTTSRSGRDATTIAGVRIGFSGARAVASVDIGLRWSLVRGTAASWRSRMMPYQPLGAQPFGFAGSHRSGQNADKLAHYSPAFRT
jgi:hypothetical protein